MCIRDSYYINQFISLGYSIPGAVVALAVIIFITYLDNLNDEASIMGNFSVYFLILIYAYVIRFMAVGKSPIKSSLEKHPDSYDNSAKNLGLSNIQIFKKIYFDNLTHLIDSCSKNFYFSILNTNDQPS